MKTNLLFICGLLLFVALDLSCAKRNASKGPHVTPAVSAKAAHDEWLRDLPISRALYGGEGNRKTLEVFLERLKRQTTAQQLQEWAAPLLVEFSQELDATIVSSEKVPLFVEGLEPPFSPIVIYVPQGLRDSHIKIDWGGGMGHWGVAIGEREFAPCHPDFLFERWNEGVFVYVSSR